MTNQRNAPPEIGDGADRATKSERATTIPEVATTTKGGTGAEAKTEKTVGAETRAPNT